MNIQEMIDSRIEKLQSRQGGDPHASVHSPSELPQGPGVAFYPPDDTMGLYGHDEHGEKVQAPAGSFDRPAAVTRRSDDVMMKPEAGGPGYDRRDLNRQTAPAPYFAHGVSSRSNRMPMAADVTPSGGLMSEPRRLPGAIAGEYEADDDAGRLAMLGDSIETALGEVAVRVLDITDRLAGDYARLEREMLASRLDVLASVEAVLDIALSLRRETRGVLAAAQARAGAPSRLPRGAAQFTGDSSMSALQRRKYLEKFNELPDCHPDDYPGGFGGICQDRRLPVPDRASMHEHGVAALFRKTQ